MTPQQMDRKITAAKTSCWYLDSLIAWQADNQWCQAALESSQIQASNWLTNRSNDTQLAYNQICKQHAHGNSLDWTSLCTTYLEPFYHFKYGIKCVKFFSSLFLLLVSCVIACVVLCQCTVTQLLVHATCFVVLFNWIVYVLCITWFDQKSMGKMKLIDWVRFNVPLNTL